MTKIRTKIIKQHTKPLRYLISFFDKEVEVGIYLTQNELERIEDQIADILLETLDT